MEIKFVKTTNPRQKPDFNNLGFGKVFADYMFMADYTVGIGWHDAQICPYGPLPFDPAQVVLHYAQETFEGLKAYKTADGRVLLFRPDMNAKRMINSNKRLCMPELPVEDFVEAVSKTVMANEDWIPTAENSSLYIRPFCFAYESALGVHAGSNYKFMIICSPSGNYYKEGLKPVKIFVEDEFVRAVQGGTGFTKCGGNYAASIIGQVKAEKMGYSQVLWLDGVHRKYVEEVGTMNVMFVIDNEVWTCPIDGSVLPGVTRDSIIHILKDWGIKVREERLSIDDLMEAGRTGHLQEAFGTGTAAVVSPIGHLRYKGEDIVVSNNEIGSLTQKLFNELTGIQWGRIEDKYGWTVRLK